ncbi:MAG: Rab family GTPase [Candidatus Heimdallarchaeota archaeon]
MILKAYKTIIAGNAGVGKTTLLHQYIRGEFRPDIQTTIGSNFFVKYVQIPQVKSFITLQIWDLAGQERFKWVRQAFYKGAKGIVYMFDLTRRDTFENLQFWKKEIENIIGSKPNILVGNKLDLIGPEMRCVTSEELNNLKNSLSSTAYFEASAKFGQGIDEIFDELAIEMYKALQT